MIYLRACCSCKNKMNITVQSNPTQQLAQQYPHPMLHQFVQQ